MIFDFIAQEDDIAAARKSAGISEPGGGRSVLQRIFWRYFLALWSLIGLMLGLKAMAVGIFLIWIGHPVLSAMGLNRLERQNRLVTDSGQHTWFVSIGGVSGREKIASLKNAFFHTEEEMRLVLTGMCRVRFLLYVFALCVAAMDGYAQWPAFVDGDDTQQLSLLMSLANLAFFLYRSMRYYRLLRLGQRQKWHVGRATINGQPMFSAYKACRGAAGRWYVPYLLAIMVPQVA